MTSRVDGSAARARRIRRSPATPPLRSDGETAALVSHDGSFDRLRAPRLDGPSVFARILDLRRGRSFSLRAAAGDWQRARRYAPETNVPETTYSSPDGHAALWDFTSLDTDGRHGPDEVYAHGNPIRLIECHAGATELEARIAPRPGYARHDPRYRRGRHEIDIVVGTQRLNARCDRRSKRRGDVMGHAARPLDLTFAPIGHIVVASERPFAAPDGVVSIREYDPARGHLVRVFVPDRSLKFRRPRGLRFAGDGRLYCVGENHVVAFDFSTREFLGTVVELPRLNGQALVLLEPL